jgi:protein-S-isoprenylcysteine O-methyltransferase
VSFISALLGGLAVGSLALAARPVFEILGAREWGWARSRLGMYGAAMGMFHLLEFWTTAGWNPQKLSVDGENIRHYVWRK